ncbi:MAG: hypothetical protein Kow0031_26220 [Anaerolineae bacterium]
MFDATISDRITEMTFKPVAEIGDWLARLGLTVTPTRDGAITIHNPWLALTTALTDLLDPPTRAVTIAFSLMNVHWPQICPSLLPQVNREWRRRRQTAAPPDKDTPRPKPTPADPSFATLYRQEPTE